MKIILATKNKGKAREIGHFLQGLGIELFSLLDLEPPQEYGKTFKENALIKARHAAKATGIAGLADDSGLEVDFLGGRPGVFSARYAGERATDRENNDRLLKELEAVPHEKRGARFICALALVTPEGKEMVFEGALKGFITESPKGENGFGYDPIFHIPELKKTAGELTLHEKSEVGHRGKALKRLKEWLLKR
ncbi:MAG: XTP/dITP diphosphatase [Deltaproteobacteria bacterium]|nr:XTP/dITP diphosphatase [Deltaproteobacteria bacterium]